MEDTANAFIDIFRVDGGPAGSLTGLTFGTKDLFDVADRVTGCGNPEWARTHSPAERHAWAVERLLAAGATLVGKTHTDELAYSLMGVNAHYGTPLNSRDPRRVPGGSSSGSASAVAAGLVDIGLGTDTGGSIRLPASFCGLWGLRPTFDAISLDGVMPFTHSFDTVGWMTRDGALLGRVAEALGCSDGPDIKHLLLPVDLWSRADALTVTALQDALERLQANIGAIRPIILAPTGLDDWREVFRICQAGEIWDILGGWVSDHTPAFGPGTKERFEMAANIDEAALQTASDRRSDIRQSLRDRLPANTALVLPTSPSPAPFLTASDNDLNDFRTRALEMLCPAGLAGLPQVSVPVAEVEGGPVGLSLTGSAGQDLAVIRAACDAGIADF